MLTFGNRLVVAIPVTIFAEVALVVFLYAYGTPEYFSDAILLHPNELLMSDTFDRVEIYCAVDCFHDIGRIGMLFE